jgi:hypothetical protein
MNSFDSIKININDHFVQGYDKDYFNTIIEIDNLTEKQKSIQKSTKTSKLLPIGIGQIIYSNNAFTIQLSAKILKDNYLKGINLNTIDQVCYSLKDVININPINLVNDSNVFAIDATTNLNIENIASIKTCISTLHNSVKNPNYKADLFNSKNNNGVVLWGKQKKKHRLIAYDKYLELREPKNKDFRATLQNQSQILDHASKIIRIESNFMNLDTIRKGVTGSMQTTLSACLNTEIDINHKFLLSIVANGKNQLTIFDIMNMNPENKEISGFELLVQDAIDTIIIECKYNEKLIKDTIKNRYFTNVDTLSYHWAKKANNIKSRIHFLRHQSQINNLDDQPILDKILNGLKNQ